ncbi:hypothetical protein V2J09_003256 [Rumex salicifolius]
MRKKSKKKAKNMAVISEIGEPLKPSWLLVIFCLINLVNYIDRGAIASNGVNGDQETCTEAGVCSGGTGIQGEFSLSNFEDGLLSSAFMVGLLIASPIFASLAKRVNPFRLIGAGLSIWTIAVIGCGFSYSFWFITLCRMLVGVGEASFISLAAPFIDDNAPVAQKSAWLGAFYMCIPTGNAFGYIYGGLVGTYLTWRWAFWIEAMLMLPFVILGFSPSGSNKAWTSVDTVASDMQDSDIPITDETRSLTAVDMPSCQAKKGNEIQIFWAELKVLLSDEVYVVNVLGYIAYNFVLGAYSYWGPKAGYYIYQMTDADIIFGGITVVSGVLGSVAGGMILDYINSTIHNAFKLLSVATFLGAIFCFSAFCFKDMIPFLVFLSIGELFVFATQAPVNYVCLHCVKPSLRPLSMAMSTVAIHVFGDVPSSPLVGILEDQINNWRITALVLTSILFIAAIVWFLGIFLRSSDKSYEEDSEGGKVDKTNNTPLLEEKKETPSTS